MKNVNITVTTTINGIEGFSHNDITYTCNTSTNRCYRDVAGCKTRISLAVYRQCREEAEYAAIDRGIKDGSLDASSVWGMVDPFVCDLTRSSIAEAFPELSADTVLDILTEMGGSAFEVMRLADLAERDNLDEINDTITGFVNDYMEALAPKAKAPRRSKNTAYTKEFDGVKVTLTTKQVDFIKHTPDTDFYESGLDSTLWIDVLIDQITNGMGAMTIGAMVSTLRQKGIIMVGGERINGRESKCFKFTGLGKQVAADLGLK